MAPLSINSLDGSQYQSVPVCEEGEEAHLQQEIERMKILFPKAIAKRFGGYEKIAQLPVLELPYRLIDRILYVQNADGSRKVIGEPSQRLNQTWIVIQPEWMSHDQMRGIDLFGRPFIAKKEEMKMRFEDVDNGSVTYQPIPYVSEVHPGQKGGKDLRLPVNKEWTAKDWGSSCAIL